VVGKSTELYQTDDGTRLLILPYGGRILGIYASGSEENLLWTNSALNRVESARAYYAMSFELDGSRTNQRVEST
jgi:hypothetical protein